MRKCTICGHEGYSKFCPECGAKMEEIFENNEMPTESTENVGCESNTTETYDSNMQGKEETVKEDKCNDALENESLEEQDVLNQETEISDNTDTPTETIAAGDQFDSADKEVISEENRVDTSNADEEQKRLKRQKNTKIGGIIVGILLVLVAAILIIKTVTKDSIKHDMNEPYSATLHSLDYKVPEHWALDNSDSGLPGDYEYIKECKKYVRFNKEDNSFMGRMQIFYLGDDITADPVDFYDYLHYDKNNSTRTLTNGKTKIIVKEYDTELNDIDNTSVKLDTTTYIARFTVDYSDFYVIFDVITDEYDSQFFDQVVLKMSIDKYKNPRLAKTLSAEYTGSTSLGTSIVSGSENVTVTVEYDNGDKDTAQRWSMNNSIMIEEGKTNKAKINCHGLTCNLEVTARKPVSISAQYNGATTADTKVSKNDIVVTIKYDTGEEEIVSNWDYIEPITLKAGETSVVNIKHGELSYDLKIACTTLTEAQYKAKCAARDYKDQLRKESTGVYITIHGKVLQDCGSGYYRISSNGDYDDVYMVYAPDSDIVEDDLCTVYGQTAGIYTYETVLGSTQKVPEIFARYVDR